MAEYVNPGIVTVPAGQNVPMASTAACGKPCIVHREGSGLVTLRGHYSRADGAEHLRTQLNDMMRETDDERVRDALRRAVSLMEN